MKVLKTKYSWFKESGLRIDASYHLSDGPLTKIKLKKSPYKLTTLANETSSIFKGNIFKRTYVDNPETGYPFMTGSDIMKSEVKASRFISKRYTGQIDNLFLKKEWILLTRSGTIGNTVFTNENFERIVGTDDLIRIIPEENKIQKGFLYAYLSSKYGNGLLTQSSYGGVIKHIEPHHIEDLPIPIFPSEQQQHIHELIMNASKWRVEANQSLENAKLIIEKKLPSLIFKNIYISNVNELITKRIRLDATSHLKAIGKFYNHLIRISSLFSIRELSSNVFTPNIFKRMRVTDSNYGIPFLGGANLLETQPKFDDFLSKKMKNISDYLLREGWLAIQDSGSLSSMGYVSIIPRYLNGVAATNNLVRIVPKKEKNFNPYIYAFLKTNHAQKIIKSKAYGTGQLHIDNRQIENFLIPVFEDIFDIVTDNVNLYLENINAAFENEKLAISIIENEIESWQS